MATTSKIFDFIELKYDYLTNQINTWLKGVYKKSDINFNSASPYGQILNVQKELFQHNIIYLKNAVRVLDITTTQNKKVIQQTARIAGHSVGRAISATGTLKFTLRPSVKTEDISGGILKIPDGLLMKNKTNSLQYVSTGGDKIFSITEKSFSLPIVQGKFETQTFTGQGKFNQSFSVNVPSNAQVENSNSNITITYNGRNVLIKDHLYDMLKLERACYIRSGFNGGIDIYFGNKNFGFTPAEGSVIQVTYLLSNGAQGEILNPVNNDWKIQGDITDGDGESVNVEKLFNISVENDINFASDGESLEQTKSIIPFVSRNFVLGTPDQFIFHLRKLNMFSQVDAYNKLDDNNFTVTDVVIENAINKVKRGVNNNESKAAILGYIDNLTQQFSDYKTNKNDNQIYLYLIPDITKYFNDTINYFNIPMNAFYLDNNEKDKIINYLKQSGNLSPTIEINIIQPKITRYVMHVYVRRFDYADEDTIKQQIIATSSDYFLTNDRYDRISKSDLVSVIKGIDGIDSASIYFVGEDNEMYHKKGMDLGLVTKKSSLTTVDPSTKNRYQPVLDTIYVQKNGLITPKTTYDPNNLIGIDSVHGDIVMGREEYAIIRGGWRDRDSIYYSSDPNEKSLTSINIIFDGVTKKNG